MRKYPVPIRQMQVFLGKNIKEFHNLYFNQLMMYFSSTLLSFPSKFLITKCTAGEYCVNEKRDDDVYICVQFRLVPIFGVSDPIIYYTRRLHLRPSKVTF